MKNFWTLEPWMYPIPKKIDKQHAWCRVTASSELHRLLLCVNYAISPGEGTRKRKQKIVFPLEAFIIYGLPQLEGRAKPSNAVSRSISHTLNNLVWIIEWVEGSWDRYIGVICSCRRQFLHGTSGTQSCSSRRFPMIHEIDHKFQLFIILLLPSSLKIVKAHWNIIEMKILLARSETEKGTAAMAIKSMNFPTNLRPIPSVCLGCDHYCESF